MYSIEINVKKCKAQLKGISIGEKILHNIMLSGIHGIDKKSEVLYKEKIKELGNYYIKGIQEYFFRFISLCIESRKTENFFDCINSLNYLYSLLKKSKKYINDKIECSVLTSKIKNEMFNSSIEEQIGYSWKLSELKQIGLYKTNIDLVQVAYTSYNEVLSERIIEEGVWFNISTGEIYKTKDYKVYKPKSCIKEEMITSVLNLEELYIYPGEKNPKIKLGTFKYKNLKVKDLELIKSHANNDFFHVINEVKSQIKNPLGDKNPIYILKIYDIRQNDNNELAIFDEKDIPIPIEFKELDFSISKIGKKQLIEQAIICYFRYDIARDRLLGIPVAIINSKNIISLFY